MNAADKSGNSVVRELVSNLLGDLKNYNLTNVEDKAMFIETFDLLFDTDSIVDEDLAD